MRAPPKRHAGTIMSTTGGKASGRKTLATCRRISAFMHNLDDILEPHSEDQRK